MYLSSFSVSVTGNQLQEVTPLDFERMMETMEKSSENNVISLLDAKQLFSDVNHDTLAQIYDYWLNKRLSLVCSFTPTVSHQLLLTPRRGQAFSQIVKIYVANSECCCKRENSGVSQNTGLNTWRILCRFLVICSKADHEM